MALNNMPHNKISIKPLIIMLIMLAPFARAQAQDSNAQQSAFAQRLTWSGDEFATRYEVIIEKNEKGEFRTVLQEFTKMFFIEISLPPGKYRYRVVPYDFLDRPSPGSVWVEFEIRAALPPELRNVTPRFNYSGANTQLTLSISGKYLEPEAGIYLRGSNGSIHIPQAIHIQADGTNVRLFFDNAYAIPQQFVIVVINPTGLENSLEMSLTIPPPPVKPVELYLGAAWMPLLPLFGDSSWIPDANLVLPGAAGRCAFVYAGRSRFPGIGVEAAASWFMPEEAVHAIMADADLLAQMRMLDGAMAVRLRLGAGYAFLAGAESAFHTAAGFSVLWNPWSKLYLEVGMDFAYWPLKGENTGCLRPWVGAGWKF